MEALTFVFLTGSFSMVTVDASSWKHQNNSLDFVFWNVRPFVFPDTKKPGYFTGILPMIFERAHAYCSDANATLGMLSFNEKRRMKSYRHFQEVFHQQSAASNYNALLENTTPERLVWGPIINDVDILWASKMGYHVFNLMKADKLAVIVRREEIDLINKFLKGLIDLKSINTLAILCSCIMAVFIWFAECRSNDDFSLGFTRGFSTAFWFCIVSMTTVGYGDIVVKTPLGRFIALFWLICGVLLASVCTAALTSNVSGTDSIAIFERKVAVLKDSFEAKIASHDYSADIVTVDSYEEILSLVRRGDVYAGVMMENVTGWYQEDIQQDNKHDVPLSIVKTLPASIHILLMSSKDVSKEVRDLFRCMYHLKQETYDYAQDKYTRSINLETTYVPDSFEELVTKGNAMRTIVILAGSLIAVGFLYDAVCLLKRARHSTVDEEEKRLVARICWLFGCGKNGQGDDDEDEREERDSGADEENVILTSIHRRTSTFANPRKVSFVAGSRRPNYNVESENSFSSRI